VGNHGVQICELTKLERNIKIKPPRRRLRGKKEPQAVSGRPTKDEILKIATRTGTSLFRKSCGYDNG